MIPAGRWDLAALAGQWSEAAPFPHLVLDDLLAPPDFAALAEAAWQEPLILQADEIFQHRGSAEPPAHERLRAFAAALGSSTVRRALEQITGVASASLLLRAYRYDRGDYLLPHTDWRPHESRVLAFAYYLGAPDDAPIRGGELELFDCALEEGQLVRTTSAKRIEPRPNRLALFSVSAVALHQVRELLAGQRLSLAGWFLA